jgi:tRNA(fMet)-specific endonuclease VapC
VILSLDSNVVIDVVRGRQADVRRRFAAALADGHKLKLCSLALHELIYGAYRRSDPQGALSDTDAIMGDVEVEDFTGDDAVTAGEIRAKLSQGGVVLSFVDLFIAAQAAARGWAVVTNNIRHLGHVPELTFYDWRVSDRPMSPSDILGRLRGK